ncbi:MAG: hypothetical protein AAGB25_02805, partial [Pseudomonadota bacterium]
SYAASGAALAASVATGAEVYLFVCIFCAFFAANWALTGPKARRGTIAFGVSFSGVLVASFFATVAPTSYSVNYCDALSRITVLAGGAGGLGLAAIAAGASGVRLPLRLAMITILGVICLCLLKIEAPQCLSNPLSDLPEIVQTLWLADVKEARPLISGDIESLADASYRIGVAVLALCVVGAALWRGPRTPENWRSSGLMLALLLTSVALTLLQIRFFIFAHLFAFAPLAAWVGALFVGSRQKQRGGVGYIAALAASIPFMWSIPSAALTSTQSVEMDKASCHDPKVAATLNSLATGRVLASPDDTPFLLRETDHSALDGNYHRNAKGIEAALTIFTASPETALASLHAARVDYVFVCMATASTKVPSYSPDGLLAELIARRPPAYLIPVYADDIQAKVYRVQSADEDVVLDAAPQLRGRLNDAPSTR